MRARNRAGLMAVVAFVVFSIFALGSVLDRRSDFREWCAGEGGHANRNATECRSPDGEIILRGS